jgi:hypothetical protein
MTSTSTSTSIPWLLLSMWRTQRANCSCTALLLTSLIDAHFF